MSPFFFFVQLLNAVQYALILYLVASGLTLLLGIMGVINLAHGAFYMVGAYVAFAVVQHFASFWLALPVGILIGLAIGAFIERFLLSRLDGADHLSQVLLSFGLILIVNEGQRVIFGNDPHSVDVPKILNYSIPLSELFLTLCIACSSVLSDPVCDCDRPCYGEDSYRHDVARQRREPRHGARAWR